MRTGGATRRGYREVRVRALCVCGAVFAVRVLISLLMAVVLGG